MLNIKNLCSGYGKLKILKDIDFTVKPGQIVSIIGPNGAGKSTILKSIFNLCDIYSGKIIFKSLDITKLPTYDLILEGISYSPQGRQIFPDLTVYENLEMGLYIFKDREYIKRKLTEILKRFIVVAKLLWPLLLRTRNYHFLKLLLRIPKLNFVRKICTSKTKELLPVKSQHLC
jgi:branched-chain amino acid transport system ATP-binding protein